MKKSRAVFLLSLLLVLPLSAARSEEKQIVLDARRDVALSVFNDGLALVREVRQADIPAGTSRLKLTDIPVLLMPESVRVQSLTAPQDFYVARQVFEQNTADAHSLLDKFVGKQIKVVNWNQFQDRKETLDATLLSNDGDPVYLVGNEVYIGYPGAKILPGLPEGFVLRPSLTWEAGAKSAVKHDLEISYLTSGISWKVDYVMLLKESGPAELTAWATLSNESGASFQDAGLRLVAGQVNRTYQEQPQAYAMKAGRASMAMAEAAPAPPSFEQQSLFEYHAYDLSSPVSLENHASVQLPFFQPKNVTLEKEYKVESPQYYYGQAFYDEDGAGKLPVNVYLKTKNTQENGLGAPLPQGTVRLYQQGAEGRQTFAGEDALPSVPQGETVRLRAGQAFDITARRKQTDYKQLAGNTFESAWQVTLKNAKAEDVEVLVSEPLSGNWQVIEESQPHEKLNANLIQFRVKVPKNGETVLDYRVKTGY
ncbi:MAG TPA: DUF4139 domain-containing protein [Verrucomicrobiae bacterium]|nr:DUF4139 domain-containing protein [Verrucomicrobiae bacterium]